MIAGRPKWKDYLIYQAWWNPMRWLSSLGQGFWVKGRFNWRLYVRDMETWTQQAHEAHWAHICELDELRSRLGKDVGTMIRDLGHVSQGLTRYNNMWAGSEPWPGTESK